MRASGRDSIERTSAQIGGSARCYQELSVQLSKSDRTEQA
jgi:hypothetical protein